MDGVYYQLGNEDVFEKIKVHLDGKLQNRINGRKTFKGIINFEGKEIPKFSKDRTELLIDTNDRNFSPVYSAFRIIDDLGTVTADIYNYGWLYTDDRFTKFSITIFPDGNGSTWSPSNGFMISVPTQNKVEAMNISQKLMKEFGITINN